MRALLAVPVVVAVLIGTNFFGLVGLRYPRWVENNPLLAPVNVVHVTGNALQLEDGRTIEVKPLPHLDPIGSAIEESGSQVDVEENPDDPSTVIVFWKSEVTRCGTPWVKFVNLPLIRQDVPSYRRWRLGVGRQMSTE